jgi:hypothetical protein
VVKDFWVKNYSACPLIQIENARRKREIGRKGGKRKIFFNELITIQLSSNGSVTNGETGQVG